MGFRMSEAEIARRAASYRSTTTEKAPLPLLAASPYDILLEEASSYDSLLEEDIIRFAGKGERGHCDALHMAPEVRKSSALADGTPCTGVHRAQPGPHA